MHIRGFVNEPKIFSLINVKLIIGQLYKPMIKQYKCLRLAKLLVPVITKPHVIISNNLMRGGGPFVRTTYSKLPDLGSVTSRNLKNDLGIVSPSNIPCKIMEMII